MRLKSLSQVFVGLLMMAPASAQTHTAPRFTVSQVGLHFICTADGQPDMYSWRLPVKDTREGAAETDFVIPEIAESDLDAQSVGPLPLVSGGRTALRVLEHNLSGFYIEHRYANGFDYSAEAVLTNVDDIHWRDARTPPSGLTPNPGMIKGRYYSNYPPLSQPDQAGRYGTVGIPTSYSSPSYGRYYRRHPGYDSRNWNWTLDRDMPLEVHQKRLQSMLYLELHTPPSTDPDLNYDITLVISSADISGIQVNNRAIFSSHSDVVIKTQKSLFQNTGVTEVGGLADGRKLALGRRVGPKSSLPEDGGYDGSSGSPQSGRLNLDIISHFFTENRDVPLNFTSGLITLRIYDTHDWQGKAPLQTVQFRLPAGAAPAPDLVTTGSYLVNYVTPSATLYNHPAIQAPHWWSYHRDGALARFDNLGGRSDPEQAMNRSVRGRCYEWIGTLVNGGFTARDPRGNTQRVPGARALIYGYDALMYPDVGQVSVTDLRQDPLKRIEYAAPYYNQPVHFGSDTIRTLANTNAFIPKTTVTEHDWIRSTNYEDNTVHLVYGMGFDLPRITRNPLSQELKAGQPATLAVEMKSTTPVTYQWQRNQEPIPGATERTYRIDAPNKLKEGDYQVVVTNSLGSTPSEIARLTFFDPVIISSPQNQTTAVGGSASFTVSAEGTNLSYQWRRNGRDLAKATQSTLTLSKVKITDHGSYDVVVTGEYGSLISAPALLTVNAALAITQQPVGGTVREGDPLILAVKAIGPGMLDYQWFREGFPVPDGNSDLLLVTGAPENAGLYQVIVSDADLNKAFSATVRVVVVGAPPVISQQPESQRVELGDNVQFNLIAEGEGLSYQWRKKGKAIAKATSATLTLPSVKKSDEGPYDCVVKNATGGTLSQTAHLQLGAPLTFITTPDDQTLLPGESTSFTAEVTGGDITYQWYHLGKAIPGATYNTLLVSDVDFPQAGHYLVTAHSASQQATASASATLQIIEPGILVYKLSGTGQSTLGSSDQRVTLTGILLVDRQGGTPQATIILTRKEGRENLFEVQHLSGFRLGSTGMAPKSQTAFIQLSEEGSDSSTVFWLQGADSFIALPKAGQILAPRTLSGDSRRLEINEDPASPPTLENISLKAILDTASTSLSRQRTESLDHAIERVSTELLQKGYVELPSSD